MAQAQGIYKLTAEWSGSFINSGVQGPLNQAYNQGTWKDGFKLKGCMERKWILGPWKLGDMEVEL